MVKWEETSPITGRCPKGVEDETYAGRELLPQLSDQLC